MRFPAFATVLATLVALSASEAPATDSSTTARAKVKTWTIHYRSHSGARRSATVLLPAWYGPRNNPPIPLIISPHGRGLSGRANARIWGNLPARGGFAVVNPDGEGRRLPSHSWGFPGQIKDLAKMPEIVRLTLPWVRIDRSHIYAFGGSMGGQETLLLLARNPRLLAGAAVFDSVTDLALQYRRFPVLNCRGACRRAWRGVPLGRGLQKLARREIGGTPNTAPQAYAARSPLTYARRIAFSCVPLQMWWSVADRVVTHQHRQSRRLFKTIRRVNPDAPVEAFVGFWIHSAEMHAKSRLPLALAAFGLLPQTAYRRPPRLYFVSRPWSSTWCEPRY
jgi:poly(3-hydroxybutyrate) depolymerase